jgi:hypothetical protein
VYFRFFFLERWLSYLAYDEGALKKMFYDQHAGDEYDSNAGVGVLDNGKRRSDAVSDDDSDGGDGGAGDDDDDERGDAGTTASSDSDSDRQGKAKNTDKPSKNNKKK